MGCVSQKGFWRDESCQGQHHHVRTPWRRPGELWATRLPTLSVPPYPLSGHQHHACQPPLPLKFGASVCVIGNSSVVDFKTDYDSDDTTIDLAVGAPGDDTENSGAGQRGMRHRH